MTNEDEAKEVRYILNYMRVHNEVQKDWNVYQIGCVSSPLNFASQQQRAFKLTYALDQKGHINGQDIAVIGAGLSGLTAAIVCLLKGAKSISLYEKTHDLMPFQYGALHRYVHPMIFKWPESIADTEKTKFPILNWEADNADVIRRKFISEIYKLLNKCANTRNDEKFYRHRVGADVRHLVSVEGKIQVLAEAQLPFQTETKRSNLNLLNKEGEREGEFLPIGFAKNFHDVYDVVIVAVGFGIEKKHPDVLFRSYWHLDTLSQPTIRGPWPRRWLVSGTGDGGLIDAIRLVLFEVDQKNLTNILLGKKIDEFDENVFKEIYKENFIENWNNQLKAFRDDLVKAISKIKKFNRRVLAQLNKHTDIIINKTDPPEVKLLKGERLKENKLKLEDYISEKIQEIFRQCLIKHKDVNKNLKIFLQQYRRTDTVVYLNGTTKEPYQLGTSLFHCLLIFLLRRDCGLRYRCGELEIPNNLNKSNTYRVLFKRKDRHDEPPLEVDDIVIRHGVESTFGILFGTPTYNKAVNKFISEKFDTELWEECSNFNTWCSEFEMYK